MYMPKWKKILIVIVGLWEILLFSGTILGWTSLKLMLKNEGIYDYKCKISNASLSSQNSAQLSQIAALSVGQPTVPLTNLSSGQPILAESYTLKINFTFTNNQGDNKTLKQVNDSSLTRRRFNSVKRTIVIPFQSQDSFNKSFIYTLLSDSPVVLKTNSSSELSLFNEINDPVDRSNLTVLEKFVHLYMEENLESPHLASNFEEDRCKEQELTLNLAFSIGSFCMGAASFIWGFLLERWGLRIVRLVINSMITIGAFLLCFTTKGQDWLLFPAILIMSLGGVPIRIVNMQFCNLYPSRRSTIISVYSGAFSASSIIYVIIQYIYAQTGISFFSANLILVLLSLLMIPFTLFILPPDKVAEPSARRPELDKNHNVKVKPDKDLFPDKSTIFAVSKITLQNYKDVSSPNTVRKNGFINQGYLPDHDQEYFKQIPCKTGQDSSNDDNPMPTSTPTIPQDPPLSISLKSFAYNLHQMWFSWMITYMLMNVGSMNLWAKRVTDDRAHQTQFISFFGLFQVTALLISPLAGILMDWKLNQANKELDPLEKQVKRVQSGFWPLFITNLTLLTCVLCHYFDVSELIYISIVFVTIYRAFLLAVGSAFLRVRFHGSHFNRLLGIMSSVSAVTSLLQIPFFEWESSSQSNVLYVNIVNTIIVFIVMSNPLYLLFTPLQRYFLKKENDEIRKLR